MPISFFKRILPAQGMFNIIPSDVNDLPHKTRGVYVAVSGNLHVVMSDGSEGVYGNLAAGMVHPLSVIRVYATGTTATGIRGQT